MSASSRTADLGALRSGVWFPPLLWIEMNGPQQTLVQSVAYVRSKSKVANSFFVLRALAA